MWWAYFEWHTVPCIIFQSPISSTNEDTTLFVEVVWRCVDPGYK